MVGSVERGNRDETESTDKTADSGWILAKGVHAKRVRARGGEERELRGWKLLLGNKIQHTLCSPQNFLDHEKQLEMGNKKLLEEGCFSK